MAKWVKKKMEECHEETAPLWYITYADMITQITAFFVVMFSLSEIKGERMQAVMRAFQMHIGVLPRSNAAVQVFRSVTTMGQAEANVLRRGPPGRHTSVQTLVEDERTKIVIGGQVGFEPGEWRLTAGMAEFLRQAIGPEIRGYRNRIEIRGHTASAGGEARGDPGGDEERLIEVGYQRANAVRQFLAEQCGIDARRMRVVSCADHEPLAPNDTDAGRRANRRVEIIVTEEIVKDPGHVKQERRP